MIVDSQSISYCLTFGRGEGHKENEFAVALRRENRVYGVTVFTKERAYSEDVIKRSHHFGSDIMIGLYVIRRATERREI